TLLGALTITFVVIQFVPGGPIETLLAEARASQKGGEGAYKAGRDSDAKQIAELKKLCRFDALTSALVLVGYAIPGFVLGVLLIVVFAGGAFLEWFPLRSLTSDNWA